MARTKRGIMIVSALMLGAMISSACSRLYSQSPVATFTPLPQSNLFASAEPTNMSDIQAFATGSAIASNGGAPVAATATLAAGVTPLANAETATATPIVEVNPTATATLAVSGNAPTSTSAPASVSGTEWILKEGEFPYCIARRYNVDPTDLINASGLTSPDIYYEGQKLIIPQNSTWPSSLGPRGLLSRPSTYTVTGNSDTTVYGVACKFGDVDPSAIASSNNISVDATLTVGQTLNIP